MKNILILDGNMRSALAATRSLGRRKVRVIAADATATNVSGCSRFSTDSFKYISPYSDPDAFVSQVREECKRRHIDILYPMTDISCYHILKNRKLFPNVLIPCPDFETYEQVTDKWKLLELAQELGIAFPHTVFMRSAGEVDRFRDQLRYPLVIKPYRSRMFSNGHWIAATVRYAANFTELKSTLQETEYFQNQPVLLQQYIFGENQGVFALYDHGKPIAFFSNRRLRDKPPSGGVVTLSESTPLNPKMYAMTRRLFDHLQWHGVAMVEIMVAENGTPYMLEVNGRFWASTQLSVDCGVDFPWFLYQISTGSVPEVNPNYPVRQRSRWLLGDLIHLGMTIQNKQVNPFITGAQRWRALAGFFNFYDRRTKYEINRWNDLAPCIEELKQYIQRKSPRQGAIWNWSKKTATPQF